MICPNCESEKKLKTVESFDTGKMVYRKKKCLDCAWTYTTHEIIVDDMIIPNNVRNVNRKKPK